MCLAQGTCFGLCPTAG